MARMRRGRRSWALATAVASAALAMIVLPASAQTLQERIQHWRRAQAVAAEQRSQSMETGASVIQRRGWIVASVRLSNVPAREALNWWSRTTGVPMVVEWGAMEQEGIDPNVSVNLALDNVPAGALLGMILRLMSSPVEVELIDEWTPQYVQVTTKRRADQRVVLRVYDVGDLLMEVPSFDDAPSFDLSEALGGRGRGAGGGGSRESVFSEDEGDREREERSATRRDRGEALAQLIREMIEPGVWRDAGGQYASVRYHNGRLIVVAPMYVHRQIGMPVLSSPRALRMDGGGPISDAARAAWAGGSGVSGVGPASRVSSVR